MTGGLFANGGDFLRQTHRNAHGSHVEVRTRKYDSLGPPSGSWLLTMLTWTPSLPENLANGDLNASRSGMLYQIGSQATGLRGHPIWCPYRKGLGKQR